MKHPLLREIEKVTEQNVFVLGHLTKLHARCVELKRQRESYRNTLKQCRRSRDAWKAKAQTYRLRITRLQTSLYDARRSRDMWRERALHEHLDRTEFHRIRGDRLYSLVRATRRNRDAWKRRALEHESAAGTITPYGRKWLAQNRPVAEERAAA